MVTYERYKAARALSGMTQIEAAKFFGVSRNWISRWDCGLNKVPNKYDDKILELEKYAQGMGIAAWEHKSIKQIKHWYDALGVEAKKKLKLELDTTIT